MILTTKYAHSPCRLFTYHVELLGNLPSLELPDVNMFLTYLMPAK
jgi:hypothetical protein